MVAQADELLHWYNIIELDKDYHSIGMIFRGTLTGAGDLDGEVHPAYGDRQPRWFTAADLADINYYPAAAIDKALTQATE